MMKCCKRSPGFSRRILLPSLLFTALLAAVLSGCGQAPENTADGGQAAGLNPAADFSLSDLQGTTHRLSDYRGKVVVLNFWDTWCPPCRQEIPDFIAVQQQYGSDDLQLLGVALGKEGAERVKQYAAQARINYPVLLLGNNNKLLADYGGVSNIPVTFIIDQEGNTVDRHLGFLSKSALEQLVKPLLQTGGGKS